VESRDTNRTATKIVERVARKTEGKVEVGGTHFCLNCAGMAGREGSDGVVRKCARDVHINRRGGVCWGCMDNVR
jgi:hypothetical protein